MAVAAARNCLGPSEDRSHVRCVLLATNTPPFTERLNSEIVAGMLLILRLRSSTNPRRHGRGRRARGNARVGLAAVTQAISRSNTYGGDVLVLAADRSKTRAASTQELEYGDGAAALLIGRNDCAAIAPLARWSLSAATASSPPAPVSTWCCQGRREHSHSGRNALTAM